MQIRPALQAAAFWNRQAENFSQHVMPGVIVRLAGQLAAKRRTHIKYDQAKQAAVEFVAEHENTDTRAWANLKTDFYRLNGMEPLSAQFFSGLFKRGSAAAHADSILGLAYALLMFGNWQLTQQLFDFHPSFEAEWLQEESTAPLERLLACPFRTFVIVPQRRADCALRSVLVHLPDFSDALQMRLPGLGIFLAAELEAQGGQSVSSPIISLAVDDISGSLDQAIAERTSKMRRPFLREVNASLVDETVDLIRAVLPYLQYFSTVDPDFDSTPNATPAFAVENGTASIVLPAQPNIVTVGARLGNAMPLAHEHKPGNALPN